MLQIEYWNYLDRPETFVGYASCSNPWKYALTYSFSIGDSDNGLGRMLEVLRFWFTKDLVGLKAKRTTVEGRAYKPTEVCEGKTLQTLQFYTRRILSGI